MEHRQPRTSDSVLPALQKISGDDDDDDGDDDDDEDGYGDGGDDGDDDDDEENGLNELQCITNVRSA